MIEQAAMAKRTNRVEWQWMVVVAMGVSLTTHASTHDPFVDLPSDHWAAEAIYELADEHFVNGYPDRSFAGRRPLTRYEFAFTVQRLAEEPGRLDFPRFKPPSKPRVRLPILNPPFPDVPKEHWASYGVEWLREYGIVAGYSDGTFRGDRLMSRNEVSIAIHRLCNFFVWCFGTEPSQGLDPLRFGSGTGPISRYEFAVVMHQAYAFYGRTFKASMEPAR